MPSTTTADRPPSWVSSATRATPAIPKKVGALPIDGGDAVKQTHEKKATGKRSTDTVYGLTDHTPESADAAAILACNRGHWSIENSCHYLLDWNGDEDRCTIRTGHGPANITALRRFAIGAIKSKSRDTVAATIQRLARNVRRVFDFLGMTEIACRRPRGRPATAG